jgi:DNA-binding MarR family transcriptional regulator
MPRRHYTKHLDRLTIPASSTFWERTHHRSLWITPQQYRLLALATNGWQGTQRDLAKQLNYSLGGLNHAIHHLYRLGFLNRLTRRGRHGWTKLVLKAGSRVLASLSRLRELLEGNVQHNSSPSKEEEERPSVVVNISVPGAPKESVTSTRGGPPRALRDLLAGALT